MSLDAWYGRVTVEQLLAAIDDRKAARALINDVLPDGRCDPAEARALSIGTTWDSLAYLLESADGPAELVHGASFVPYLDGCGYLTDDQVHHIAKWLATVTSMTCWGASTRTTRVERYTRPILRVPSIRSRYARAMTG
jgi:hypothetical protein